MSTCTTVAKDGWHALPPHWYINSRVILASRAVSCLGARSGVVVISQHGLLGSSPEPVFSPCTAGEAEVMHTARQRAIAVSLMQPLY